MEYALRIKNARTGAIACDMVVCLHPEVAYAVETELCANGLLNLKFENDVKYERCKEDILRIQRNLLRTGTAYMAMDKSEDFQKSVKLVVLRRDYEVELVRHEYVM